MGGKTTHGTSPMYAFMGGGAGCGSMIQNRDTLAHAAGFFHNVGNVSTMVILYVAARSSDR